MSSQGSNNRLCIFEFKKFINPGSVSYLELQQTSDKKGAWVPLKSLSQALKAYGIYIPLTKKIQASLLFLSKLLKLSILKELLHLLVGLFLPETRLRQAELQKSLILKF